MKRYTKTFWNGLLEDPKGIWVKEEDVSDILQFWIDSTKGLEQEVSRFANLLADEETLNILLKWLLSVSITCNIGQLIYYLN